MKFRLYLGWIACIAFLMLQTQAFGQVGSVSSLSLQGQNKGDTNNWSGGNLQNWQELDMIPCRVLVSGAANNQSITITFPHLNGTTPGFENLYNFTANGGVTFASAPVLSTPAGGTWSYTFSINSTSAGGSVNFFSRLAAGAHVNPGSSLKLGGSPSSMGELQIHKPQAGPGAPNLAVVKTGPVTIPQGGTITYTLSYTNKATGTNVGVGVQLSDILPDGVVVDPSTLPANANLVGDTLFFDLPDLAPGAGGQVMFQAGVPFSTPVGTVLNNFAQILSSQDDADNSDNTSTWKTTVTNGCTGVTISTSPSDQAVCPGSSASFMVSASGTGLTYQWYKGASALSGQTNNTLTLNNVGAGDAATYKVVVAALCGNPVTNSANLTLNSNVIVSTAPSSVATCPGTSAGFSVNATGTSLSYQWYKGASALSSQTNNVLTLNNVGPADQGTYSVVVSGVCGTPVTNSATLTVNSNVNVSTAPSSVTTCPGTSASFSVNASGTSLSYQWFKGASALSNQTNNVLTLNTVGPADQGAYSVVVSGVCGTPVTNSATLTVNSNVIVSTAPSSVTTCPGTSASFSVNATGTSLSYQWYKGASALSSQTNNVLTLNNVGPADQGAYSVVVSGVCGTPVTNSATLTVNSNVNVSTAPSSVTTCPGTSASFSVNASGTSLSYQWFKGASALSNQTNNVLTLNNVGPADQGIYSVVVSGVCGTPVTNGATLTVNSNVIVSTAPSSVTTCPGTSASFSVNATGTTLSYQWFKGASALTGQTNNVLTLNSVSAADQGIYSVVVAGVCGTPVTNSATLTVNSNVIISTAPTSVTTCPGTPASFSVNATGTSLSYQWFKGAGALSGQINTVLTLNGVSAADQGTYSVVVTGVCGTPVTNSATLTVNSNVIISTAPSSVTTCPGTSASFSVNASGTSLSYQWFKGAGALGGQTNNVLTLNNVGPADQGTYSVVVTGVCGTPVTNSATLAVNSNVIISTAPSSVTTCPGTSASFSVNATGTSLSYQWFKGAGALSGQTNNVLTLNNVGPADQATYSVVVTGVCGTPVTNNATLTVNSNVIISTAPSSVTTCPGTSASFSVNASGTSLSYQWFKGAGALGGQTNNVLTLNNVGPADQGTYSVVVTGVCGTPVTNSAALTVNSNVIISTAPSSVTTCPGTSASFSVNASGTSLSYQWFKGAGALGGQTNNVLILNNVGPADQGAYSVVVTGVCGTPVTNSATLTVNSNVIISTAPSSVTTCPGTSASFSVNATGTSLSYQWYKGAGALSGQTNSVLTLNNVGPADQSAYSVVVTGICGTPVTNSATLTVNWNVIISTAPSDVTTCPGTTANFSVNATGTSLNYQWFKGASALNGQTNNSLTLNNVGPADQGAYSVVVTGVCGTPVTNSATLTVNSNVLVTVPPVNSTNCPGTTANFAVNATGTGLTYQWYKGNSPLNGQNSSTLTLNNVSSADAATYSVVVSGTCGGSVTNSAVLVVNQNVSVAPLVSVTNNIGSSVTFTAVASGTGPFSYQWFKGATALSGQTNSTLTLNNLQPGDSGAYSVSVTGACGNAASAGAVLTVNQPPTVMITHPTNGAVFVAPATFQVTADASDPDGTVTNVAFFMSTNGVDFVFIGETNATPYQTIVSNLPVGQYTFVAQATDNFGATGNSAPVTVNVVPPQPPTVTVVGKLTLNLQDGFQWLTNVVCNPALAQAKVMVVSIHNITNSSIRVVNATGTNNGVPFVASAGAILPGTCWTNVIKFYDPLQVAFAPVLTVDAVDSVGAGPEVPVGTPQPIFSGRFLRDGTFLVEFTTVNGSTYYVQYSTDMVNWNTVFPSYAGTGQHFQFVDSGPPQTQSLPSTSTSRFYRVLKVQ